MSKQMSSAEVAAMISKYKAFVRSLGATDRQINLILETTEEKLMEALEEREEEEEEAAPPKGLSGAEEDIYWSNQFGALEAEQEAQAFMRDMEAQDRMFHDSGDFDF